MFREEFEKAPAYAGKHFNKNVTFSFPAPVTREKTLK